MCGSPARCAACITSTTLWCGVRASALITTTGGVSPSAGADLPSAAAIADVLARRFNQTYENIYTFYLDRPAAGPGRRP